MNRWTLIFAGHIPVIINGWSIRQVAAYERRYYWRSRIYTCAAEPRWIAWIRGPR